MPRRPWLDRRSPALILLVLAAAGPALAFHPGLISYDTNATLLEAQRNFARDWFTPLGSGVLNVGYDLGIGLGVFYAAQIAVFVVGTYGCLRLSLRRVPAAVATAAVCAFPVTFAQLASHSRDMWWMALSMLAFGLLAWAARAAPGRARGALAAAALAAAVTAFLMRQNGLATVACLAGTLAVLAFRDPAWRPARLRSARALGRPAAAALSAAAGVLAALVTLAVTQVAYDAAGVRSSHPERILYVYDLAAITADTGRNVFPPELPARAPGRLGVTPPDVTVAGVRRAFDHTSVLPLYPGGDWTRGLDDAEVIEREHRVLGRAWRRAVLDEPGAYLEARARLAASQLGFDRRPLDAFWDIVEPTNFSNPPAFERAFRAARDYARAFVGPEARIHLDVLWPYLLLALGALAVAWRPLGRRAAVAAGLVAAAWANAALIAVVAMATSFRYTALAVPAALVLVALALGARVRALGGGPSPA